MFLLVGATLPVTIEYHQPPQCMGSYIHIGLEVFNSTNNNFELIFLVARFSVSLHTPHRVDAKSPLDDN
jgi:hypothetical protein